MGNSWKYKCPWCLLIYKMTILILLLVLFLKNTLHKIYLFIELFIFIIIYKYQAVTPERCIHPKYFVPPIWIDLQNGIQNCCASVNLTLGAKRQKTPTFFFFLCCFVLLQKLTWEKRKIILVIFVGMGECLLHPLMYTYHIYSPKKGKIASSSHDFEVTNCDSKS